MDFRDEIGLPLGGFLCPETPAGIFKSLELVKEKGIQGNYYEFGVFRGDTLSFAALAADLLGLDEMMFYGFDSFAGLPEPEGIEREWFEEGEFRASRSEVIGTLRSRGVILSRVRLIGGFYDESLNRPGLKLGLQPAAVALIDCDLYSSAVQALKFLEDLIQEGSIVLFDEWNWPDGTEDTGERRAFGEFLERNPTIKAEEFISFGGHGQAFILRKETQ